MQTGIKYNPLSLTITGFSERNICGFEKKMLIKAEQIKTKENLAMLLRLYFNDKDDIMIDSNAHKKHLKLPVERKYVARNAAIIPEYKKPFSFLSFAKQKLPIIK